MPGACSNQIQYRKLHNIADHSRDRCPHAPFTACMRPSYEAAGPGHICARAARRRVAHEPAQTLVRRASTTARAGGQVLPLRGCAGMCGCVA